MESDTNKKTIVSFRLIGSRILHTWLKNNPKKDEIDQILEARRKFLEKSGLIECKFVELLYLPANKGTIHDLNLFLEKITFEYSLDNFQLMLLPYNAPRIFRLYNNSLKRFFKSEDLLFVYKTYLEAEKEALKTLYSQGVFSLYGEEKRFGEEIIESDDARAQIIFVNETIFYIEYRGVISKELLISLASRTEEIILDCVIETEQSVLILNIQETLFPEIAMLKEFLETLAIIQENFPFNHHVIISRSQKWNDFLNSCINLYPASMIIVKNFASAVELSQNIGRRKNFIRDENISISFRQLHKNQSELNQYLKEISLDSSHIDEKIDSISPGNILKQLFYSFSITFYVLLNKIEKLEEQNKRVIEQVDKHRLLYDLHLEFEQVKDQKSLLNSIIFKIGPNSYADRILVYKENLENGDFVVTDCWEDNMLQSIKGLVIPKEIQESFFESELYEYLGDYHLVGKDSLWRMKILPHLSSIRSHVNMKAAVSKELTGYKGKQRVILSFQICKDRYNTKEVIHILKDILKESDRLITCLSLKEDTVSKSCLEEIAIQPIDKNIAIEEFDGDEDFLMEVIKQFFQALVLQIELVNENIKIMDFETIHQESHKIKGAAGNLFAIPLQNAATKLDDAAQNKDSEEIRIYFEKMKEEAKRLAEYLHISATIF